VNTECVSTFQIPVFLKDTYYTTSIPRNSKKCFHHTRTMVSHFTYGLAYLSWVNKRTDTYNVRKTLCTLEWHQCISELKNKQVCHDLQLDFPLPLVILSYCSILNCSKLVWSISTLFCSSSITFFKVVI